MKTGIFIRAQLNGHYESVDIGDKRLPTDEILAWLRSRGGKNVWAENCVLILLGREQIARENDGS